MKILRPYILSLLIILVYLLAACGLPASNEATTSITPAIPNPRPFVNTLTLEQFTAMMRSGVKPDDPSRR